MGSTHMGDAMLKRIRITGYRSIRDASIDLDNINILIGPNGGGKSNFLSALELIQKIISQDLQTTISRYGVISLLYNGPKETKNISIETSFENDIYGFSLELTEDERMIFSDEYLCQSSEDTRSSIGKGYFESKLIERTPDKVTDHIISAKTWRVYHFDDTSRTSLMRKSCSVHDNLYLMPDARNIAPFLLRLKEEYLVDYNNIVSSIRIVAPFFDDFILIPNTDTEEVMLKWKRIDHNDIMWPNQLSDGTLRFVCLTTLLLQPKRLRPTMIILDEPELGLSPQAIICLAEMIKSVGKTDQLIISTQSTDLIDEFTAKDVIVVKDDGSGTTFSRLDLERLSHWLDDGYTFSMLWRKNLLTSDY